MTYQLKIKGGLAGQLDPQSKLFLDGLPKGGKSLTEVSPEDIRSNPSPTIPHNIQPAPVFTEEIAIEARDGYQIKVRIYRKEENAIAPPLMYYHGGCWVFCNLDTHDAVCRRLCYDSGFTVFSVDYRLAPEGKFPLGINDAYDAAKYISENNDKLKVKADDLIVAGDSAGGNISTVVALMAKESKEFKVRGQVLYYPITDASQMDNESYNTFAEGHFLTKDLMAYGAGHYVNTEEELFNPLVSPLLSEDLAGLPKTLIQTAEFDVLRDEAEAYAEKLAANSVDVECVRYNGMVHGYISLAGKIDLGREAIADSVEFLKSF